MRAEIITAARDLFTAHGFEAVTVEQIVEAAGVSRRTFFRYFGAKEEVVLGDLNARGDAIARALARRPDGEDPWQALRGAILDSALETFTDPVSDLALGKMIHETPALSARSAEKRRHWQAVLTPLVAERMPGPDSRFRAAAVVAATLACLDVASTAWLDTDGTADLGDLFDRALTALRA